jgi:hypothetical protein
LPPLPDSFYKTTWERYHDPRGGGGWYETYNFSRDTLTTPGVVTITRHPLRPFPGQEQNVTTRKLPLAVYGPLVEFDGRLHMVAVVDDGVQRPALDLETAIEVRKNLWYQAKSTHFTRGKPRVEECQMEFSDDPRIKDEGRVTVRYSIRMTDEERRDDGEFDVKFKLSVVPNVNRPQQVAMPLPNGRAQLLSIGKSRLGGIFSSTPSDNLLLAAIK